MVIGTIQWDFKGEQSEAELEECDMLFAVGIKQVEKNRDEYEYVSQNMVFGWIKLTHAISCLAKSIMARPGKMFEEDPIMAYTAMQQFKKLVGGHADQYMLDNLAKILEMKRGEVTGDE